MKPGARQERRNGHSAGLNKLRPLLLRPEMRAIIGQTRGSFRSAPGLHRAEDSAGQSQLGSARPGDVGAARQPGCFAALAGHPRPGPPSLRSVAIRSLSMSMSSRTYLHLPVDLADALAQARGLGSAFALAHQYLHQLGPTMRSAVLANAQSRVAFRLPSEDARMIASGSTLDPEDFQSLGAFQCYAQLVAGAAVQPWCSGSTLPPSKPLSDPARGAGSFPQRLRHPDRAEVESGASGLLFGRRSASERRPEPTAARSRRRPMSRCRVA